MHHRCSCLTSTHPTYNYHHSRATAHARCQRTYRLAVGCHAAAQQKEAPNNTCERLAAAAHKLKTWVEKFCAPWPAQLQPVVRNTAGEHSMVAAAAISEGQVLLQVPEALFITANKALNSKHCGRLVRSKELPEWQALVLHLLCERAAGAESFWAPYIAVLGDQRHHPLLWSSEVQGLLTGSPMLRIISDRMQQVQQDADLLVAAGANDLEIARQWQLQRQEPLISAESVAWAAAVLLGRSFQLDMAEPDMSLEADMSYYGSWNSGPGPVVLALVPWADMLRHSSEAGEGSMLVYDPEARAALLSAHRYYQDGDEVFDSHGPGLSHADLVMDHGCVGEGTADNPRYDALLLQHVSPRGSRNAALMEALQVLTGGSLAASLTPTGPDVTTLAAVRACVASDAELIKTGWRLGSKSSDVHLCARVMGRLSVPLSAATEQRVLEQLQQLVDACITTYPSSIQQDEAELQHLLQQQQQQGDSLSNGSNGGSAASTASSSFDGCDKDDMRQQRLIKAGILRALISEKTALLSCREVLSLWVQLLGDLVVQQQQLQQQQRQQASPRTAAASLSSEQLAAAVYELLPDGRS